MYAAYTAAHEGAALFALEGKSALRIRGEGAKAFLKTLLCGYVSSVSPGGVGYSPMLNLQGGTMDECFFLCVDEDDYVLVVNEGCREKDLRHMKRHCPPDAQVEDVHEDTRLLAVLGPEAQRHMPMHMEENRLCRAETLCAFATSRLGAPGYVLLGRSAEVEARQARLLAAGVTPGTQAQLDALLLENGIPAYGREMDDTLNPLEVGLRDFVMINRKGFLGREALVAAGEPRRGLIALALDEEGARGGMEVLHRDKSVGVVTSVGFSPVLGRHAAMALVEKPYQDIGRRLRVECGERLLSAWVTELPLRAPEEPEA